MAEPSQQTDVDMPDVASQPTGEEPTPPSLVGIPFNKKWDVLKPYLHYLYFDRGLPLSDNRYGNGLMTVMRKKYGFDAKLAFRFVSHVLHSQQMQRSAVQVSFPSVEMAAERAESEEGSLMPDPRNPCKGW